MMQSQSYLPSFIRRTRVKSELQKKLLQNSNSLLGLDKIKDFLEINKDRRLNLEIGFGDGSHLIQRAINNNEELFIGCEVYLNGIVTTLKKIKAHNLENVVIFNGDAREVLDLISPQKLHNIYILFPDPWPKKKHHKRRIITAQFVNTLLTKLDKTLKTSKIIVATDHQDYAKYISSILEESSIKYDNNQPLDWIPTKYQLKASIKTKDYVVFNISST